MKKAKTISTRTDSLFLIAVMVISVAILLGSTSNARAQQPLLPNLTPLPAYDIFTTMNSAGEPELRFSFRSWNNATGPLEMIAGEVAQGRQNVYQRIYNDDGSYADRLAGNFEWHQGHNHFHFDDYALYMLPAVTGNSNRTSTKTSFCLMDTTKMDGTLPGAPNQAAYDSCGNFFQGISVGWGDTYGWHLPGQEISLSQLQSGDYRLVTTVDPQNRILEANETDNESCVLLRLGMSASPPTVEILNNSGCDDVPEPPPPPGNEVTVDRVVPDSASKGSSVLVVITGSGFTSGMNVRLKNGKGAKPTVSNVDVQNSTTITALITLKRGAKLVSWDVRVGSGTLVDGFTVTR